MCSIAVFRQVSDDLFLSLLSRRIHTSVVQWNAFFHCILNVKLRSDGECDKISGEGSSAVSTEDIRECLRKQLEFCFSRYSWWPLCMNPLLKHLVIISFFWLDTCYHKNVNCEWKELLTIWNKICWNFSETLWHVLVMSTRPCHLMRIWPESVTKRDVCRKDFKTKWHAEHYNFLFFFFLIMFSVHLREILPGVKIWVCFG